MSRTTMPWCIASAFTLTVLMVAACAASDPIVYTERVPYEWETWSLDAGLDGDSGSDGGDDASTEPPKTSEGPVLPPNAEKKQGTAAKVER